jgi:hypothetical protein
MSHVRYKPVKATRLFSPSTLYSELNWNDFPTVVQKFKEQLLVWYLAPAEELLKTADYAFAAMSLACTLVDTIGQYFYGVEEGTKAQFKGFLDQHFPDFAQPLAVPIQSSHQARTFPVTTLSDAIYHGFRCGIIHEAHVKLYTGVVGQDHLTTYHPNGYTLYSDDTDCPTVIVDPSRFVRHLKDVFENYFASLLQMDPAKDYLRTNFKRKFLWSFGIDIGNEV